MASPPVRKVGFEAQLEERLMCPVCLEMLKEPRALPCLHSFCTCCLEKIVRELQNKSELNWWGGGGLGAGPTFEVIASTFD